MVSAARHTSFHALRDEFRPTLSLALPLVLAEVGWMSMGVVDTIMVGRLPNSAVAIGATGLAQSLYNSVAIFGAGLLLGLDTFVAQAHGRDDIHDAHHSLVNGFSLALILTPILMMLVSLWPTLMRRFGVGLELIEPMQPFLSALNWGTLPLLCYFSLRRYLQAVHVVHPIMFALISANVVNLVGDWALIYGYHGFGLVDLPGPDLYGACNAHHHCVRRVQARAVGVDERCSNRSSAHLAPSCARRTGGDSDSAGNRGFLRRYSALRKAWADPALWTRDRSQLRRVHLHGSPGDQFGRGSSGRLSTRPR